MRSRALLFEIVLLFALSCSDGGSGELSALLRTVPSRSVAVMHFDDCGKALELLLDSTHVFRSINYGRLSSNEAILSYDYSAGLVPLLCLDAGRSSDDSSSVVRSILQQAEAVKLSSLYTADLLPKRAALLLSPSKALIAEALEHISSGSSILDAPGFPQAAALVSGGRGSIFLKNGSASRLLPRKMLGEYVPRKDLVRFFSGAAEWTVLGFGAYSREDIDVQFWGDGKHKYLCEMFAPLKAGDSEAAQAVPAAAEYVLGLPLKNAKDYLSAWQECLDMRAELSKYKGRLAGLKKNSGINPEGWFAQINPKEVVIARWDGHELLLIHPSKKAKPSEPAPNPHSGFIPALLGESFRLADDSFTASAGGWTAFGSEEDVAAWLEAEKGGPEGLPRKAKCYLLNNELSIAVEQKNTVLNVW